jgi:hypothetical protein
MALQLEGLKFDELPSDPATPVEGQMWYNSTSKLFKGYKNGAVFTFSDGSTGGSGLTQPQVLARLSVRV